MRINLLVQICSAELVKKKAKPSIFNKMAIYTLLSIIVGAFVHCNALGSGFGSGLGSGIAPDHSGVPCYLQPAGDSCHYDLKPGSETCTSLADRIRLSKKILLVNRTLVSLEQQLVRLGVIPPDDICSELPAVSNGGVIYSNINLGPGTTGRYICNDGYTLNPLADRYEFTCTIDGVWDGDVIEAPVECLLSSGKCKLPDDIINGTIEYTNDDPSHIFVGDVILYSCDEGCQLVGPSERYCQRNESWSGPEPECTVVAEVDEVVQQPTMEATDHGNKQFITIGYSVASGIAGAVLVVMLVMISLGCYKCASHLKSKQVTSGVHAGRTTLAIRDDSQGGTPYRMFQDSPSEPQKKKKKKSSSKPTSLTIESTAL